MAYLLALDQGTTSSRAIVFDNRARPVGSHQVEFEQHFPRPGWVEHDPEDLWRSQIGAARGAIERSPAGVSDLSCIGITNQRETTLIWDRNSGEPLHNAIVWQDRRTTRAIERFREQGLESEIHRRTGLVLDPYFSASKLQWILDNMPNARERAREGRVLFGTVDSWLVWKLTNGETHVTDASNASRTMLFNLDSGDWDPRMLELFEIPRPMLPTVTESAGDIATTDPEVFGQPVPITGLIGDQQASLFGQRCTDEGMTKTTYGTGCFMLMNVGIQPGESSNRLLSTVGWKLDGETTYALEGSVFMGGAVVQWLRDKLKLFQNTEDIEALAGSVENSDGVIMVPAFTGLGAPHWDARARGALLGMTRGTDRAHIARAALDAIAHQVVDVLRAMEADIDASIPVLKADGGAAANDLLLQIQSNLLNARIERPQLLETTALGSALMAGYGSGIWSSQSELDELVKADRGFEPLMNRSTRQRRRSRWEEALERAKNWEIEED